MERRIQTACLLVLTTVAAGFALYWLRSVMIPFVLAAFISVGLTPVVEFQRRRLKFPRALALLATLAVALLALVLLGTVVSASVGQLSANASVYVAQVGQLLDRLGQALPDELRPLAEAELEALSQSLVGGVRSALLGTTNAIVDILSKSTIVLIFVVFLMLGEKGDHEAASDAWREAQMRVRRYLVTKMALSAATGALVGLVLASLGVPLALVFGLFAFLLNFIPSIGSIIATLLPLPVVLVSPDISSPVAVLAIAIPGTIQMVIGNFLDPKIMGESLDLHPAAVLIALMTWATLWGIAGMFLAVPITAVMKIVLERIEPTRAVAELMAGRLDALRSPQGASSGS